MGVRDCVAAAASRATTDRKKLLLVALVLAFSYLLALDPASGRVGAEAVARASRQPVAAPRLAMPQRRGGSQGPSRSKDRVAVHGKRVWINRTIKSDFVRAMEKIRSSKRNWTQDAWATRVAQEVIEHWGGQEHGGSKRMKAAQACGGAAVSHGNLARRPPDVKAVPVDNVDTQEDGQLAAPMLDDVCPCADAETDTPPATLRQSDVIEPGSAEGERRRTAPACGGAALSHGSGARPTADNQEDGQPVATRPLDVSAVPVDNIDTKADAQLAAPLFADVRPSAGAETDTPPVTPRHSEPIEPRSAEGRRIAAPDCGVAGVSHGNGARPSGDNQEDRQPVAPRPPDVNAVQVDNADTQEDAQLVEPMLGDVRPCADAEADTPPVTLRPSDLIEPGSAEGERRIAAPACVGAALSHGSGARPTAPMLDDVRPSADAEADPPPVTPRPSDLIGPGSAEGERRIAPACGGAAPRESLVLPSDLSIHAALGNGSYGRVYACVLGARALAVKIRKHPVQYGSADSTDKEISILKHLELRGGHSSIIRLLAWRQTLNQGILFLFFERCAQDLLRLISASGERAETLGVADMMHLTAALCSAVAYMHARSVVHRDLKPQNILLRREPASSARHGSGAWQPLICDFGNSKIIAARPRPSVSRRAFAAGDRQPTMTRGVTTLWYAAPEMLVANVTYSFPVDIWALGLTLAQVEHKTHLFASSLDASDWEQLLETWVFCQPVAAARPPSFPWRAKMELLRHTHPGALQRASPRRVRGRLGRVYGDRFRAFVSRCLQFDPCCRASAEVLADLCRHSCDSRAGQSNTWIIG